MSIAEKLTTIAENIPKVYNTGYAKAVEGTCREFHEKGIAVRCEPVVNYPTEIISELTPSADGYTSVTLTVLGKNLLTFTKAYDGKYITHHNGKVADFGSNKVFVTNFIPCSHLQSKVVTWNHSGSREQGATTTNIGMAFYTDNNQTTYISGSNADTFKVPENANYMRFTIYAAYENETQLELGQIITAFEPYIEKTYTVDFDMPVYGGSYNWNTGKLTETYQKIKMSELDWIVDDDNVYEYAELPYISTNTVLLDYDGLTYAPGTFTSISEGGGNYDESFDIKGKYIAVTTFYSPEELREYLESVDAYLTYSTVETTTDVSNYQSVVLNTGTNTICSNTGDTTVKGRESGYTEYDHFWDNYQGNGNRINYQNAFIGEGWNNTTFKPKYDLIPKNATTMFDSCGVTDLVAALERAGIVLDLSKATRANGAFQLCKSTRLPVLDLRVCTSTASMFYANTSLKWVEKFIVGEGTDLTNTGNCFAGADALEHIIFEGVIWQSFKIGWCPLDHESIMSILNCLKDYAGSDTTYTLTLGTENLAKLEDEEKLIATEKGWTLA